MKGTKFPSGMRQVEAGGYTGTLYMGKSSSGHFYAPNRLPNIYHLELYPIETVYNSRQEAYI